MAVCDTGGGLRSLFRPALVHFHWQLYLPAELFQDNKLQQPPFLLPRAWLHPPGCCIPDPLSIGDGVILCLDRAPLELVPVIFWGCAPDYREHAFSMAWRWSRRGLRKLQKTCRCHFRQVYMGNISLTKPVKHKPVSSVMKQIFPTFIWLRYCSVSSN